MLEREACVSGSWRRTWLGEAGPPSGTRTTLASSPEYVTSSASPYWGVVLFGSVARVERSQGALATWTARHRSVRRRRKFTRFTHRMPSSSLGGKSSRLSTIFG